MVVPELAAEAPEVNLPAAPAWVRAGAVVIRRLPVGRYRAIDRICRRPPPPFLMNMPRCLGGALFECDLRDAITRDVCFTGQYEPQQTAVLRGILGPGMSFVDVGANWGYYTLCAAYLVGRGGRVVGLEPDPRLYAVLSRNIARNGLQQASAVQVAAAATEGTVQLAGYDESGGNFGVSRLVRDGAGRDLFEVRSVSLDQLLANRKLDAVDLVKLDIEGAEALALEGLRNSLAERRVRRLLIELHPQQLVEFGSSAEALAALLRSYGYRGLVIDHSPAATRRAAYDTYSEAKSFLREMAHCEQLDVWPHQLWLAEGIPCFP